MKGASKDLGIEYWRTQYSDPKTIDGIGNARDHSRYLASFFNLEGFEVESMVDLGFGTGHLFKEMLRTFRPNRAAGIEPSEHVFRCFKHATARVRQTDLLTWCLDPKEEKTYDLGLCTSMLQYLDAGELLRALPVVARRVRYLYLTVPTDVEYERQGREQNFADPYAHVRSRIWYQRLLRPHFTFLSTRVLESKHHYDEQSTPFNDLLFRF